LVDLFKSYEDARTCESQIYLKNNSMVSERKLRKIFGPTKERDGTWRIKTNDE
jgi:hypothetical protein